MAAGVYLRQGRQSARLWLANSFASSQPTLSVRAAAVDMFPGTANVETVVRLEKREK